MAHNRGCKFPAKNDFQKKKSGFPGKIHGASYGQAGLISAAPQYLKSTEYQSVSKSHKERKKKT